MFLIFSLENDPDVSQSSLDGDEDTTKQTGQIDVDDFDLNEYIRKNDGAKKATTVKYKHLFKNTTINEACQEMSIMLEKAKQHIMPPSHNQVFFNSVALQIDQAQMMPLDQMKLQQRVLELVTQEILISQTSNAVA